MDNSFSECRYLTQSTVDEAWGVTITTAGYQEIRPGAEYPPRAEHPAGYYFRPQTGRTLQEYQIVYITKGEGTFQSKSIAETQLHPGHIFMLFPEEWHVYKPKYGTGWHAYWVGFKGYYADALITSGFFSKKSPVIPAGLNEKLVSLFCEIMDYSKSELPAYQQRLAGAVTYIISQVYAINQNRTLKDDASAKIINSAKILMRENIYAKPDPEKIAESLNISYSLFRRIFKQHTGLAPAQYQQQLRIQKAKELLTDPSKAIKEISFILDFESDYYFSTYFKRITGYTPSEYRKMTIGSMD